jgi:hypothetical protein
MDMENAAHAGTWIRHVIFLHNTRPHLSETQLAVGSQQVGAMTSQANITVHYGLGQYLSWEGMALPLLWSMVSNGYKWLHSMPLQTCQQATRANTSIQGDTQCLHTAMQVCPPVVMSDGQAEVMQQSSWHDHRVT